MVYCKQPLVSILRKQDEIYNRRKTIMADNEERKPEEQNEAGYCPDTWNEKCIKGYKHGWRPSKECRYCKGTNEEPWPPED